MKFDFTGKNALITGAGGALGRVLAASFAKAGAFVIADDLTSEKCDDAVKAAEAVGGKALGIAADVGDSTAVAELFRKALEAAGKIDVLVCCAVHAPEKTGYVHETDDDEWVRGIRVNINGAFYCGQLAAQDMKKRGSGRIINLTSDMTVAPSPKMGAVAAGKAGVWQLTRVMAEELGDFGITVNAVAPGVIAREGQTEPLSEAEKQYLSYVPGHRFGTEEDIAAAVLFLASEEAKYISGNQILADGGWSTGYTRDF